MGQAPVLKPGTGDGERGIALVAVLWVFVLLSVIAASVASTSRTEARIARNVVAAAVAEAAADAAVHRASAALVAQRGRGGEWRTDGTSRLLRVGSSEVTVSIADEGGKVDLNAAPLALLESVLRLPDQTEAALAAAVQDWRDGDDFVTPGGAEDREYARAGLPYGAKNAPFDTVDELRQVIGVTPQIYARLEPLLTVHSGSRGVDPAVAPREVLLALGIAPDLVEAAVAAREESRRGAGTPLPAAALKGFFAPTSRNAFAITAVARGDEGGVFVRRAIVYLPRDPRRPYAVLAWSQGRLP